MQQLPIYEVCTSEKS
uniref:Uncharacterized protein n=1 Tax=Arundo donax TaxID=35708 RepID=A0A0A9EKM5_ARUDO